MSAIIEYSEIVGSENRFHFIKYNYRQEQAVSQG